MANGKSKGSQWERDISRFLTNWLTGQSKDLAFYRSPSSGAVFTTANFGNKEISGDIIALKQEGSYLIDLWSIECKNGYPDISLDNFLKYNKSDDLRDFWGQSSHDAKKSGKYPMVIFKKKGMKPAWVAICSVMFKKLNKYIKQERRVIHLKWANELDDMYIYSIDEFFEDITPEIVKRLSKNK